MNIIEYLQKLADEDVIKSSSHQSFLKELEESKSDDEMDSKLIGFLDRFDDTKVALKPEEIAEFYQRFESASPIVKKIALCVLIEKSIQPLFLSAQDEIHELIKILSDDFEKQNYNIKKYSAIKIKNPEIYRRLLIAYSLCNKNLDKMKPTPAYKSYIENEIPYALNILNLSGKIDLETANLLKVDLNKPFHELFLRSTKLEAKNGIKDNDRFFRFEFARKKIQGESGDLVVKAFDRKKQKILYIRMPIMGPLYRHAPPEGIEGIVGICSSKIARRISQIQFSSERLLTNGDIASRALSGYQLSFANAKLRDNFKGKSIPIGLGTIEEVSSLVNDTDKNLENVGFSESKDFHEGFATKIDFDRCTLDDKDSIEEKRKPIKEMIGCSKEDNERYNLEILDARIKFALFTKDLFAIDVSKSGFEEKMSAKVLENLEMKSNGIFENFVKRTDSLSVLIDKINLINIYAEIIDYFIDHDSKHFSKEDSIRIIRDVTKRTSVLLQSVCSKDFEQKESLLKECEKTFLERLLVPKKPLLKEMKEMKEKKESSSAISVRLSEKELKALTQESFFNRLSVQSKHFLAVDLSGEITNNKGQVIAKIKLSDERRTHLAKEFAKEHPDSDLAKRFKRKF